MHYGNNPNSIFARTIGNRHPLCHSDDMRAHHILRHLRRHDISRRCVCRTSPRRPRPAHGWPRHRLAPQPQPRLDPPPHPATPSPSPPQRRPTATIPHQPYAPPTPAGSHTTLPLLTIGRPAAHTPRASTILSIRSTSAVRNFRSATASP